MRSIWRLRPAAVAFLPVLLTVLTLAPVAGAFHLGIGVVVLGAAVCVTGRSRNGDRPAAPGVMPDGPPGGAGDDGAANGAGRNGRATGQTAGGRDRGGAWVGGPVAVSVVRVLATVFGVAGLALLFSVSLLLGDVVYVGLLLLLRLAVRWGPRWAGLARAALLPLTAVFVVPPVTMAGSPAVRLAWAAGACLVASLWTIAVATALPRPKPSPGKVSRAARRAARPAVTPRLPAVAPPSRSGARLASAALELAQALSKNLPARLALFQVEHAVDQVRRGDAGRAAVESTLDTLAARTRTRSARGPMVLAPVDPADLPSSRARTRIAVQSAIAVSLGLLLGQTIFGVHWPWTVITVLTLSLAARSRGEVLVRGVQRLAGAVAATAVISPLAGFVAPHRFLTVGLMLTVLAIGSYLQEFSYVWWAAAVTATLALLYGLLGLGGGTALLGERLLAICVGGACAVGPALFLAPRTRDLVRKRTGSCLRRLRDCVDALSPTATSAAPVPAASHPGTDAATSGTTAVAVAAVAGATGEPDGATVAAIRRFDHAVAELRVVARPLRLRGRTRELGWLERLAGCGPTLRDGAAGSSPTAVRDLRRLLRDVADDVRATTR